MAPNPRKQLAVTALTGYATYLAYKCPCTKLLSCHYGGYFGALGLATVIVMDDGKLI